jgi:hypothetical protein
MMIDTNKKMDRLKAKADKIVADIKKGKHDAALEELLRPSRKPKVTAMLLFMVHKQIPQAHFEALEKMVAAKIG